MKTITKEIIKTNLKNVAEGKPLTIPLAILDGKFKEAYRRKFGEFEKRDAEEVKARRKVYYQNPEVKAHIRARHKAYYQKHKKSAKNQK